MAHNLYQNRMAFTGEIPWHGMGVQFENPMTIPQAIEAAALDYLVQKHNVSWTRPDGIVEVVPDKFVTVNMATNKVLGLVGKTYEVLQNLEAFLPLEVLASEAGATVETCGALGDGERVWILCKLPQVLEPLLGDKIETYMLLVNSHDGSCTVQIRFVSIRVVCQNTLSMALSGSRSVVSIKHTSQVKDRLVTASLVLKEMGQYFTAQGEKFSELASFKIDNEWLQLYEERLFGAEPRQDASGVSQALYLRKTSAWETRLATGMGVDLPGVRTSAWGAFQSAVEWADYEFPTRKGTALAETVVFGRAAEFKQHAFDSAMELIAV